MAGAPTPKMCTGTGVDRFARAGSTAQRSDPDDHDVTREASQTLEAGSLCVVQHEVLDPNAGLVVEVDPRFHAEDRGAGQRFIGGDATQGRQLVRSQPDAVPGSVPEVLAMAGRFEAFSTGRGRITPDRVQEMWLLAGACGMSLAPLFDRAGVWPEEPAS